MSIEPELDPADCAAEIRAIDNARNDLLGLLIQAVLDPGGLADVTLVAERHEVGDVAAAAVGLAHRLVNMVAFQALQAHALPFDLATVDVLRSLLLQAGADAELLQLREEAADMRRAFAEV